MLLAQFFNPLSHKFIVLGLLGPFPVSVKVWATICDPTVAMPLPKMEKKKKLWNLWMSKKKKLSRPQYFYNIFTINHTWLIIISSKNLWQINCGNGITENVKKKKKKIVLAIVAMPLPKMEKKNYEICEWVKKKSCHVHNIFTIFPQ